MGRMGTVSSDMYAPIFNDIEKNMVQVSKAWMLFHSGQACQGYGLAILRSLRRLTPQSGVQGDMPSLTSILEALVTLTAIFTVTDHRYFHLRRLEESFCLQVTGGPGRL